MCKQPALVGREILLRKIKPSDIDDQLRIGRHHEFIHMCGGEPLPQPDFPDRKYWSDWYESHKDVAFLWIIEKDGHCIRSTGFHHISEEDRSATYYIGIFDPNYHSKGIGSETTRLLLRYGFDVMQWHRIDLKVLDYNTRAIRCYEKCGFRKDGVLRESAHIEGRYVSDIIMSILDYEYRESFTNGERA